MFYKCTFVLQSSYGSTLLSWLTCCQLILTITSVVFWTISSKDEILSLPLVNSSNLYRRTGHPFLSRWLGITRKSFLEAYLYKQYSIDIKHAIFFYLFFWFKHPEGEDECKCFYFADTYVKVNHADATSLCNARDA